MASSTRAIEKSNDLAAAPATLSDAQLAESITFYHQACVAAAGEAVDHAMHVGDLLFELKGRCKHGEWLPWLNTNCNLSIRTAQTYMRLAKNREKIEAAKCARARAHLGILTAQKLLVAPKPANDGMPDLSTADFFVAYGTVGDERAVMQLERSDTDREYWYLECWHFGTGDSVTTMRPVLLDTLEDFKLEVEAVMHFDGVPFIRTTEWHPSKQSTMPGVSQNARRLAYRIMRCQRRAKTYREALKIAATELQLDLE